MARTDAMMKPQTADLLFEIGVEEMPSAPLYAAAAQLRESASAALEGAGLAYAKLDVYFTPRRLALAVSDLVTAQPDATVTSRGPAASLAFDADGVPTPAGAGFARGRGIDPATLRREVVDGVEYVFADVHSVGRPTAILLEELLPSLVDGLQFKRTQRWGSSTARFIRPIRWVVALFNHQVLPVTIAGVVASNVSAGHRFLTRRPIELATMGEYVRTMKANSVIVDADQRRSLIVEQAHKVSASYGTVLIVDSVLNEVVNLTELPTAIVGTFDEAFLRVPREILEYAMSKHQRYFAIERADGSLDNHFVVISNGDPARSEAIVRGHERVVRARLSDAAFFFDEDRKVTLEEFRARLGGVVFQEKLGTVLGKVERIERIVGGVADDCEMDSDQRDAAVRAAHLCKADLVSSAVVEFTEVQGIMGGHYAHLSGEVPLVAGAISEHYRPRFAGDPVPTTPAGRAVALADKVDTIVGIFAVGKAPRGTSDPFALRRAAIGVLQIALAEGGLPLGSRRIDITRVVDRALDALGGIVTDRTAVRAGVLDFFATRLETILRDRGIAYDTVGAVLAVSVHDPADALARAVALEQFRSEGTDINDLSVAYGRAKNLADLAAGTDVDGSLLEPVETQLVATLDDAAVRVRSAIHRGDYPAALAELASTRGAVDAYFEGVMVLVDDPALRANRLALLNRFLDLFGAYADFSALVTR